MWHTLLPVTTVVELAEGFAGTSCVYKFHWYA